MTKDELERYQAHQNDYLIGNNQFKCPICKKVYTVKGFKQHLRKEHYNKTNGIKNSGGYNNHYNKLKFKQQLSIAASKNNSIYYNKNLGEYKEFKVECNTCHTQFYVKEREKQFPKKEHYYCSKKCSHSHYISDEQKQKTANKISKTIKTQLNYLKEYNLQEFQRRLALLPGQRKNNKRFTSRYERLIRDFIIKNFPNDEWTFGGLLIFDGIGISRDLYSKKLKICFEYDGIWHYKDIHNQLKHKQDVDNALERWCIEHNYRLVRISESWFIDNCNKDVKAIIPLLYNNSEQILKLGKEY